ncbi:MAG: processing protein [Bacteroidales bacterium]|jgi:predicted Rossmann fold nucleotide-binding protein DprA/Smf involved in DNA uptake|nr:processing protein [Bacteroidales bacterium]MDN5328580.1 processing protein [Bacteroidales bacterium]
MKPNEENVYWMAVAHLPRWTHERINRLIVRVIHDHKLTWEDFFSMSSDQWDSILDFTPAEKLDLENARKDLPRLSFLAEQLFHEGFQLIPLSYPEYPKLLKENLKLKYAPPLLYVKGRAEILQRAAIAIVGSRKSGEAALAFTREVARRAVSSQKVVVSGFARGVDQEALSAALEAGGKSIIVLPQGILTFTSGFKKLYSSIVKGDLLVLSTFFPKAAWDVGLAMARNAYIYGLAHEIYVAESDFKGGTWQGATEGLKKNRNVYVRVPGPGEKNANQHLIEMGAKPVDALGLPFGKSYHA